ASTVGQRPNPGLRDVGLVGGPVRRAPTQVGSSPERDERRSVVAERAALVTGGSSGIGLAIARALGEDGYALTVSARRPEKLEAAADELRAAGMEVSAVPANMADE